MPVMTPPKHDLTLTPSTSLGEAVSVKNWPKLLKPLPRSKQQVNCPAAGWKPLMYVPSGQDTFSTRRCSTRQSSGSAPGSSTGSENGSRTHEKVFASVRPCNAEP